MVQKPPGGDNAATDQYPDDVTRHRLDQALRRSLETPPNPHPAKKPKGKKRPEKAEN